MKIRIFQSDTYGPWVCGVVSDDNVEEHGHLNCKGEVVSDNHWTFCSKEDAYLFAKANGWDVVGEGEKSKGQEHSVLELTETVEYLRAVNDWLYKKLTEKR
jgi:hypothetical protein